MVKSDDNLDKQSQTRLKDSFVGSELSVLDIRWRGKLKGEMRKKFYLCFFCVSRDISRYKAQWVGRVTASHLIALETITRKKNQFQFLLNSVCYYIAS